MDDEEDKQYRSEESPYSNIEKGDFLDPKKIIGGAAGSTTGGIGALRAADKAASSASGIGSATAKALEQNPVSSFKNSVVGKNLNVVKGKKLKNTKFQGKAKKIGPIALALLILGCGGGAVLLGQSAMPMATVNRIIEEWDTSYISNHRRINTLFIESVKKGKVSDDMIKHLEEQGIKYDSKKKTVTYKNNKGETVTKKATKALKDDYFKGKFTTATQREAGHYSTTFGKLAVKVKTRLKISFSNWAGWKNSEKGDDAQQAYNKKVKDNNKGGSVGGASETKSKESDETEKKGSSDTISSKDNREAIKEKLGKVVSALNIGSGVACAKATVTTALAMEAMGIRLSSAISSASLLLEAVQKAEAGDGSEAPIHEALATLTTPDKNGETAIESSGISELFGANYTENRSDGNIENVVGSVDEVINGFSECIAASSVAAVANIIVSLIPGAGAASIGRAALKVGGEVAAGTLVTVISKALLESYLDNASDAIRAEFDATDTASGKTYGNQISTGGMVMLSDFSQMNGASYGSDEKVAEYRSLQDSVIAQDAAYDRATLSPFDTSSEYTFLGSILYNAIIPFAISASGNSLTKMATQVGSTVSSSITSLLPSASAWGQTQVVQSSGNCPIANSVGAKATSQCLPYRVTDTSTIDDDCDAECVMNKISSDIVRSSNDSLEASIREGSELEKYQAYCGARDTQPGIYDANISANISKGVSGFLANTTGVNAIPIISDIAALVDNAKLDENKDWVNGKNCVATNESGSFWQKKGKWYQRFLEDQNLLANMGTIEKSAGDAVISAYYENNPLDDSYEGMIARYSGMTKEQVIALEEEIDYQNKIADYDATDLGPVNHEEIFPEHIYFSNENPVGSQTMSLDAISRISYIPTRNRAVAA